MPGTRASQAVQERAEANDRSFQEARGIQALSNIADSQLQGHY